MKQSGCINGGDVVAAVISILLLLGTFMLVTNMTGCSAPNCSNSRVKGFVMLRFPRDDTLREKWRTATPRKNWNPSPAHSLCEEHFKWTDWQKYKFKLKADVSPTVFCDCHQDHENVTDAPPRRTSEHNYAAPQEQLKERPAFGDISNLHGYCRTRPTQSATGSTNIRKKSFSHSADCSLTINRQRTKILLETAPSNGNGSLVLQPHYSAQEPVKENGIMDQLEDENVRLQKKIESLERKLANVKKQKAEVQIAKREAEKIAQREAKRAKTAEDEHNALSKYVHGRFSKAQLEAAETGKSQGRKWDEESVKIALKLKCAGGATGLKAASDLLMPLPSARTLRQRTSHIKFEPGIQHEIIEDFSLSLKDKPAYWSDCLLFFDDMSIKKGRQYDKGSDHYVGEVTLPGVTGDACKAQVHIFGGIAKKWKVVACYNFVSNEANEEQAALVILDLLKKAKEVGMNVLGIVCDMGNRAVLRALGFRTKKEDIVYRIPNPVDPENLLYCIPDMIHLYKSTKEMLSNNREIDLPSDVVELYRLPSSKVSVEHIEWLCLYEEDMLVKFDSRLAMSDVHSKHFQKMKVAPATHVLSEKTASSLDFLVGTGDACADATTTAWFLRLMANWKKIMTSRTRQLALSHHNMENYNTSVAVLRLVIHVFRNMSVKGHWKPVQTHIIMATSAVLELQEYLLCKRSYDFVMLGRFLQDVLENLFSLIRALRPNPTAVEFKYRLREIVLSQFSTHNSKSSYNKDDRVDILGSLLTPRHAVEAQPTTPQLPDWMDPPETFLSISERNALYRMSGYAVRSLVESKQIKCEDCLNALKTTGHEYSAWTLVTNYKEGAQVEVSDEVYRLFRSLEFNLQRWRHIFEVMKTSFCKALDEPLKKILSSLPKCHDISYKIMKKYAVMRLKQFSAESKPLAAVDSSFGSKSMGSRFLADRF